MAEGIQELRKFVAPEILYGAGAALNVTGYVSNFGGRHVLLVSDHGLEIAGWTGMIENSLKEAGINYTAFYEITPNPKDFEVAAGVDIYLENGCDMIVAVGGGSPMDCAKGIGVSVSNRSPVAAFEGVDKVRIPMPPFACIPTTAGTSADVSQFAIITNTKEKYKMALVSKGLVPDLSLIDPGLSVTMSPELTAETGLDALTHAVESYVSNASSPLTDLHAERAFEYVFENLVKAVRRPDDIAARSGMMLGSLHAGLSFSNASLGLVHSMAHALGGLLDLPHGLCNALLLEHVIEYNFEAEPRKYTKLAEIFSGRSLSDCSSSEVSDILVSAVRELRKQAGVTDHLKADEIGSETLEKLAAKALNDACVVTNPKVPAKKDIISIYGKVFAG